MVFKCKAFHVSRKKDLIHHQYFLDNTLLPLVGHHKHLGVWLDSSLSWSYHISTICAKTNKVLGLIRRTFGSRNPVGIATAFNVQVESMRVEYACPVWNPYLVKDIYAIESEDRGELRVSFVAVERSTQRD